MTKQITPIDCDEIEYPGTDANTNIKPGDANGWQFDYFDHQGNPDSFFSPHRRLDKALEYFEKRVEGLPVIVNHRLGRMEFEID